MPKTANWGNMERGPRVIVADDDRGVTALLDVNLSLAGFSVTIAHNGLEALALARQECPDLFVLDRTMQGLSGIDCCVRLRGEPATAKIPILILSGYNSEAERLHAFDSGVDDFVAKPFSVRELVARAKALLRSANSMPILSLEIGNIVMQVETRRVTKAGKTIALSPVEFKLLRFFLENKGQVLSRNQLLTNIWGDAGYVEPRTVDVNIRRLRVALDLTDGTTDFRSVRGYGYALDSQ